MADMKLIAIEDKEHVIPHVVLHPMASQVCEHTRKNYKKTGYVPPWIGYLVVVGERNVGTAAFKAPPSHNSVEIAYFIFPEHEGKGYATQAAQKLISIARDVDPHLNLVAQTRPEMNASTHLLEKLNFQNMGIVYHDEDGEVYHWVLKGAV